MANNRGGIPMYNENPQYSATISSQLPQGSPAMFGTQVAKERAGLGDAMVKLGTNVVDWAVKMQERDDNAFILEKDNEMRAAMTDLLYNPQNGLANTKGKKSFGVTHTYDEAVEKLTQDAMSGIGNPALQAKLQEHNMQWVNSLRTAIAKHEGGERFTFYSNQITGGKVNAVNLGAQIGGISGMQTSSSIIAELKGQTMTLLGWDKTMADNWEKEANSEIFTLIADDYVQRGNIGGLQSLVNEYGDKVSANALTKANTKLSVVNQQQDAAKLAEQLISEHPELIDEDGNLDEAKYYELVDKLNGENAPDRIERVLVGGGMTGGLDLTNKTAGNIATAISDRIFQKTGKRIPADWIWASMAHETNDFSSALFEQHNYGGVKGADNELGHDNRGHSYFNSDEEYIDYMARYYPKYAEDGIFEAKDFKEFAAALKHGGYFVDGLDVYQAGMERRLGGKGTVKGKSGVEPYQMPTQGANIDEQVGNLKDTWKHGVMDWVGGVVKDVFHYTNPTISSAARSAAHNAEVSTSGNSSWHVHNDALDVVFDEGQNLTQAEKDALVKYFKETGMFEEVLYHNYGSGWHLHLGGLKSSNPPQGGGSHYEERKVSGYNPVVNNAMKAYGKRKADMIKGQNERQITAWANALFENPNVINARDQSEIDVEMDKMGIPMNKRAKVMNRVQYSMGVNNSHITRVRNDTEWTNKQRRMAQADAQDSVSAWMLEKIQSGEEFTSDDVMNLPAFENMDPSNALSMIQHMKTAEASNDPYGGWYKGDTQFAFEKAVSSMKANGNLDDMYVPNLRSAITAANAERKKKNQPPMDSSEIEKFVAGQSMSWKVNGRLWGYNSSDQPRAALQPGQYVSEDGRTVYDAEGTPLIWDEDMKMYRRPN